MLSYCQSHQISFQMKSLLFTMLLLLSVPLLSMPESGDNSVDNLCDYTKLLEGVNDQERQVREELYLRLVGIVHELQAYRTALATRKQYIDMFPAVYFHVTAMETNEIRHGKYAEPVWKMAQMIAFYEAYLINRRAWDSNRITDVEPHWELHFREAQSTQSSLPALCFGFKATLESAIDAHIIYDLPRSIRYTNTNFSSVSQTDFAKVKSEFNEVNSVFAHAQGAALSDLKSLSYSCSTLSSLLQGILGPDIIAMRTKAWQDAHNPGLTIKFENETLGVHPHSPSIWSYFLRRGRALCPPPISTLFLFDMSGSMSSNGGGTIPKIEQAKNAGRSTLSALRNNYQGVVNEVAIYGFEGACREDPTTEVFYFSRDLQEAEQSLARLYTGGGTPLGKAIRAAECRLAEHLTLTGQTDGKLILLSDGQGTCGEIRPQGVYHNAPTQTQQYTVAAGQCSNPITSNTRLRYYTVGFDIPPGSPAERDLQYLSNLTGGKYLNVQNQTQLTRAFRKFNRVYRPKPFPLDNQLTDDDRRKFDQGVEHIQSEKFVSATEVCEAYVKAHPNDCHGLFNLALSYEANDLYREAITQYHAYLSLCPDATDAAHVRQQILFLEEEYRDFLAFQQEVIRSDLDFLKLHFERMQNGRSVALAMEFRGFLQEKGDYYDRLPRLIDQEDRFFVGLAEDISAAFDRCAVMIRRNPDHWDRDAIPIVSMTYLNLQDLLSEM